MFNRNPTIIINGLSELLKQVLPLLVVVGVIEISSEKLAGLISVIGLVLTYISTTLLKSQVTPEATVKDLIREGVNSQVGTTVEQVKERVKDKLEGENV